MAHHTHSAGNHFASGTRLFEEGEPASNGYYIESGEIECWVTRGGERVPIATLGPGDLVGEMSTLDGQPRSASAATKTDCRLIEFDREQIKQRLDQSDPVIRHLVMALVQRIRSTNAQITKAFGTLDRPIEADQDAAGHEGSMSDLRMELDLLRAVSNEEFELYFQPIISLKNNALRGFEALIRWNHPLKGLVSPAEFIEFAEEQDIISNMTRWCVQKTCDLIPRFQQVALHNVQHAGPLFVAVNISGRNLGSEEFSQWTEHVIRAANCPPDLLRLEVTEASLMANSKQVNDGLNRLKEMGVGITIDDFGTGQTSIAYLNRLPMTCIKVDRCFVTDMLDDTDNQKVIGLIVGVAKELGASVIAEGIETEQEAEILRSLNCDLAQGYYYSEPLPFKQALDFVRSWQSGAGREANTRAVGG